MQWRGELLTHDRRYQEGALLDRGRPGPRPAVIVGSTGSRRRSPTGTIAGVDGGWIDEHLAGNAHAPQPEALRECSSRSLFEPRQPEADRPADAYTPQSGCHAAETNMELL